MVVNRTDEIKRFLEAYSQIDLALLYSYDMECQVNVAQDEGERVRGEYRGRRWQGWTDGQTTWKSFRIPWKAATEPEYEDSKINFNFYSKTLVDSNSRMKKYIITYSKQLRISNDTQPLFHNNHCSLIQKPHLRSNDSLLFIM